MIDTAAPYQRHDMAVLLINCVFSFRRQGLAVVGLDESMAGSSQLEAGTEPGRDA